MTKQTASKNAKNRNVLVGAKILLQLILLAAIIAVFIFAAASVLNRTSDVNAEIAQVQEQINTEITRQENIEHSMNYQHSISFIEDIARRRLNLVYPDEIIFIITD
ncbi:MAG: septum formation initiator family protein [Defluviitaleaceae bacterium]|nr:septum formation initiator family protein [Defluviitaleaceae bacterium]